MTVKAPYWNAARILWGDRLSASSGDNANVTDWSTFNSFCVAIQLDETAGPWTAAYKLQWQDDASPGYVDLAASGATLVQGVNPAVDLVNGNTLVNSEARCTNNPGGSWHDGEEIESDNTSDSIVLADEDYTELQFGVNPSAAEGGHTYSFQLVDASHSDAVISLAGGVSKVTITMQVSQQIFNESLSESMRTYDTKGAALRYGMNIQEGVSPGDNMGPRALFSLDDIEAFQITDALQLRLIFNGVIIENISLRQLFSVAMLMFIEALDTADFEYVDNLAFEFLQGEEAAAGDIYNETVSESFDLLDTIKTITILHSALEDDLGLQDAFNLMGRFYQSLSEPLSLDDSFKAMLSYSLGIIERASLSDAYKAGYTAFTSLFENLSVIDIASAAEWSPNNIVIGEGLSITDAAKIQGIISSRLIEEMTVGDAAKIGSIISASLPEGVTLQDTYNAMLLYSLMVPETVSIVEALKAAALFFSILPESFFVGDSPVDADVLPPADGGVQQWVARDDFDFFDWTDAEFLEHLAAHTFSDSLSESLKISDTQKMAFTFAQALKITIHLTHSIYAAMGTTYQYFDVLKEYLRSAELLSSSVVFPSHVRETLKAIDTETISTKINQMVADTIRLNAIVSGCLKYSDALENLIMISDAMKANLNFARHLREPMTVTEILVGTGRYSAMLQDFFRARATISGLDLGIFDETLEDSMRLTEAMTGVFAFVGILKEYLGINDTAAMLFAHTLGLVEAVQVDDSAEGHFTFNVQITERTQLSDTILGILKFGVALTENLSAGEIIATTITRPTIEVRRGRTYIFTIDVVHPTGTIARKPGAGDITKH